MNFSTLIKNLNRHRLAAALGLYLCSSLISMATMSVAAAILSATLFWQIASDRAYWEKYCVQFWNSKAIRIWIYLSFGIIFSCTLSLAGAVFFPVDIFGNVPHVRLSDLGKFWYFLWPVLLTYALYQLSEKERTAVFKTWMLFLAAIGLLGIQQYFTGWPRRQTIPDLYWDYGILRFHSTLFLGHHLSVASILVFPFFIAVDFLRTTRKKYSFTISKIILGTAAALSLGALFFTYSRMLWIALPIGALFLGAATLSKKWALAILILFSVGGLGLSRVDYVQKRLASGRGVENRMDLWKANYEFFKLRPLIGIGWKKNHELSGPYLLKVTGSKEVFAGHAHNNVIDFLAGTGVLGALCFLSWSIWVIYLAWTSGMPYSAGLVAAWIVFQINGLTQVNFWEGKVQHQLMIAVALSFYGHLRGRPKS